MKISHTIAGGAVALLAVGGFGAFTGLTQAGAASTDPAASTTVLPPVASTAVAATPTVQPNVPAATPETPEAADAGDTPGTPEKPEADGPGGHEDKPGQPDATTTTRAHGNAGAR